MLEKVKDYVMMLEEEVKKNNEVSKRILKKIAPKINNRLKHGKRVKQRKLNFNMSMSKIK